MGLGEEMETHVMKDGTWYETDTGEPIPYGEITISGLYHTVSGRTVYTDLSCDYVSEDLEECKRLMRAGKDQGADKLPPYVERPIEDSERNQWQ